MESENKKFLDCGIEKYTYEFYKCKEGILGRSSYCKPCHNLRGKKKRGTEFLVRETLPEGMAKCGRCKEIKDKDQFYPNQNGHRMQCKVCTLLLCRNWQTSPGGERKIRNAGFVRKYGITLEEYEAILVAQNYLCCICEIDLRTTKADTDHCHATGKVRGILCHNCNLAIGLLKDDPKFCISAGEYLSKHSSAIII